MKMTKDCVMPRESEMTRETLKRMVMKTQKKKVIVKPKERSRPPMLKGRVIANPKPEPKTFWTT